MKFATVSKALVVGLALLLTSGAFAATKAKMQLNNPITVNGTKLNPGEYRLEWDGAGPNVEVSIVQGNTVVAKVPAKVVDLKSAAEGPMVLTRDNADGTSVLTGARFGGKKFALEFGKSSEDVQAQRSK